MGKLKALLLELTLLLKITEVGGEDALQNTESSIVQVPSLPTIQKFLDTFFLFVVKLFVIIEDRVISYQMFIVSV